MRRFYFPTQLFSGAGCIRQLPQFLSGGLRILMVTDENLLRTEAAARILALIKSAGAAAVIFSDVMPNPELSMVYRAVSLCRSNEIGAVLSLGGGSVMDTGKAVAMLAAQPDPIARFAESGLKPACPSIPHYAVPTTCGTGAEASSVAVISYGNTKRGLWADSLFPTAAFADPELLASLPERILTETAMDALSHALESFIGKERQGILQALGLEAARMIFLSLQAARAGDPEARANLCEAASMAGIAMGQSGTGMVHAMSDQLGEQFHLSHGAGIAVLLPHCLRFNLPAAQDQLARFADAVGIAKSQPEETRASAAVDALEALCRNCGIPARLQDCAASDEQISAMAQSACSSFIIENNPRPVTPAALSEIFRDLIPKQI